MLRGGRKDTYFPTTKVENPSGSLSWREGEGGRGRGERDERRQNFLLTGWSTSTPPRQQKARRWHHSHLVQSVVEHHRARSQAKRQYAELGGNVEGLRCLGLPVPLAGSPRHLPRLRRRRRRPPQPPGPDRGVESPSWGPGWQPEGASRVRRGVDHRRWQVSPGEANEDEEIPFRYRVRDVPLPRESRIKFRLFPFYPFLRSSLRAVQQGISTPVAPSLQRRVPFDHEAAKSGEGAPTPTGKEESSGHRGDQGLPTQG